MRIRKPSNPLVSYGDCFPRKLERTVSFSCRGSSSPLNPPKQNKTKQNKTKQNKTKQNKTKQNKTKQNKTKQNKTKQNKTKQNKTKKLTLGSAPIYLTPKSKCFFLFLFVSFCKWKLHLRQ
jgi:hypothetical protein